VARRCIFCGASDLTNEHVLGRWLVPYLPGAGNVFTHTRRNEQGLPTDIWTNSIIDLKIKRVCGRTCNSGWMQELDQAVLPIVTPMVQGLPLSVGSSGLTLLAAWAAKVQMLFQYAVRPVRPVSSDRLASLFQRRQPSLVTYAWVAAYAGQRSIWCSSRALQLERPSKPGLFMDGELFTMAVGHLVVQVFVGPESEDGRVSPQVPEEVRPWILPIWPAVDHISWPPLLSLDDESLDRYGRSFVCS
jgi:hypothetical protein